jgi:hypothetical protein
MRSPGVIYRRYRQLRKKILYDKLAAARNRLHCNCYYGKELTYADELNVEKSLLVCNYEFLTTMDKIETCTNPAMCNAFVNKWTKEKIIEVVNKELTDHDLKRKLYPELTVLEWALDKDLNDAIKNPGFFGTTIIKCIEFLESILRKI